MCCACEFIFHPSVTLLDRHVPKKPNGDVQSFVNDAAYTLLRAQEENMVLKPWVLLATLLLQHHHQNQNQAAESRQGMLLEDLIAGAVWLRDVSRQYGAFLHWPGTVMNFILRANV